MASADQFEEYKTQGERLSLTGIDLVKYVQSCVERDDRVKEREAKRLAQEREREAERLSREKIELEKIELEKLKIDARLQLDKGDGNSDRSGFSRASVPRSYPKVPMFKENTDSIDSFLFRFESHAASMEWPRSNWPVLLSALLEGQALSLYHSLNINSLTDYDTLKQNLLVKFQCTADGFRERFRSCRPDSNESFLSFGERMHHLLSRWIELAETEKTYTDLFDLVLGEQLLQSVWKDLAVFLRERSLKTSKELLKHAEDYRLAHPNKNLTRKSQQWVFGCVAVPNSVPGETGFPHQVRVPGKFQSGNGSPAKKFPPATVPREEYATRGFHPRGCRGGQGGGQSRKASALQFYNCHGFGLISQVCRSKPTTAENDTQTGAVAQSVPGASCSDKMYSVLLFLNIARCLCHRDV